MRCAALVFVVGAPLAACQNADPSVTTRGAIPPEELTTLAADAASAVWRVETAGCGWRGSGSAFAIDARHLITNHHVITTDSSPRLVSRTGEIRQGRVIGALPRPDVAVIEVDEDLPRFVSWARTDDLQTAEPLVVMGYPMPTGTFSLTIGEIVSFQPEGSRQALLSNAPIERGNSGGPALRRDGTVAGVITRMSTGAGGSRVAIAFTADSVRQSTDEFLRAPNRNVVSTCGQGPDYVPPVPPDFDLPDAREIPSPPSQPAPPATVPTPDGAPATTTPPRSATTTRASTTTRACPRGAVSITLDPLRSSHAPENPGWWIVGYSGAINNSAQADIVLDERSTVTIEGDPPRDAIGFPDVTTLSPGESTAWKGGDSTYSPDRQPVRATAKLNWRWADSAYGHCASDAVTAEAPTEPSQ